MKLGLTGCIGCGKSTVVGIFADFGWETVESDQLVKEVLSSDESVQSAILDRWGSAVQAADSGVLDRKAIAKIVFRESEELYWLEQLLHPIVREQWEAALEAHRDTPVLVEIPLLFEKRLETAFDLTVCISCPPEVVSERMVQRGYCKVEIEQRRARQLPLSEKIKRSNYVISNSGNIQFLENQVHRLNELLAIQTTH